MVAEEMDREALRSLAERWMALWQGEDRSSFEELHDENFVDHSSEGRAATREGFKAGLEQLYSSIPDFHAQISQLVVDTAAQSVAIAWTATGTHVGPLLGRPGAGTKLSFSGVEIIRCKQGRLFERWGEWNATSLLEQMRG